jgi:hypothetical protein
MKMKFLLALLSKILSIIAMISMLLSSFPGCDNKNDNEEEPVPEGIVLLSDYSIVRPDNADDLIISQTVRLKSEIKEVIGYDLPVTTDASAEGAEGLYHLLKHFSALNVRWILVSHLRQLEEMFDSNEAIVLHTADGYKIV